MLTIKQPVHYGFKSVHDLPTPPSTSRPSPPLVFQDFVQKKPLPAVPRSISPPGQPMSAPHRGLPPPAAMTLAQPPAQGATSHPVPPPGPPLGQAPPPPPQPPQSQLLGQLPAPPQWQGSEEPMKAWLMAKAEEEKRKAEEERTRQETLRLEQRRTEHDILRTSLQGGIPPPMVPMVFAGMGGGNLPQAALEMAQQFMYSQAQQAAPQQLLAGGPVSPDHRRDSQAQAYVQYTGSVGVPSTPGSAQAPQSAFMGGYPGSPTRARGFSSEQFKSSGYACRRGIAAEQTKSNRTATGSSSSSNSNHLRLLVHQRRAAEGTPSRRCSQRSHRLSTLLARLLARPEPGKEENVGVRLGQRKKDRVVEPEEQQRRVNEMTIEL
ncbi:hypothetical protein NKR23_g7530 [Pleurostoma richardsiae]|uniref:Uncharacterized protein n=1 Tax=Pleurostoma richardsiae TaxID=41990 RepID=A0AA38VDD1_9PEZI|nr:hypothetical protein NKR23_g7530 [Pleurostoma richardsiae]